MVEAKRGPGRPPKEIPTAVCDWLDKTYSGNAYCEMEVDGSSNSTKELLSLARLYCKRNGKKLKYEIVDRENKAFLRMRMRDIRKYSRKESRTGESS